MMSEKPFQFGLATLFKATTLFAVAVMIWLWTPWELHRFLLADVTLVAGTIALVLAAMTVAALLTAAVVLVQYALKQGEWRTSSPPATEQRTRGINQPVKLLL